MVEWFGGPFPRGPIRFPILGHAPAFVLDKPGFLIRCRARHGDTVPLEIAGPTLLVSAPEDVRHVLVSGAGAYGKSHRIVGAAARQSLGVSVITAEGEDHVRLRREAVGCFRPLAVAARLPTVERHCERFNAESLERGRIDSRVHIASWVARCIVAVLLGEEVAHRDPRWPAALERRRREVEAMFFLGPYRFVARLRGGGRDDILSSLVDAAFADGSDPTGILAEMSGAMGVSSREQLRERVVALLLAGYETTTVMIAWTLDLLARNAAHQESCEDPAGAERVLSESLRLRPPTWLVVRVAKRDDVLPGGYSVEVGRRIYLSPAVSHLRPESFVDPLRFDPDRFGPGRSIDPFAYFPFGAGARACVGETLARAIGRTLLSRLMQKARVEPLSSRPPRPRGGLTLQPAVPVRLGVRTR